MDETTGPEYRVSCVDTDGNARVIYTRCAEAAQATADFWAAHRPGFTAITITER